MKFKRFMGALVIVFISATLFVYASSTLGTIDPNNTGDYKAQVENSSLGSATTINFGKFTTQSSKNITVSNTELRGFAWGDGVGWIVMNCADTTSGCSSTNGNFKVANNGSGLLSGYAWGQNTGWVNFGPFTNPSISRVKITSGSFGGSLADTGYAWAQNYGWIKFDCSNANSCVKTDWGITSVVGGGGPKPQCSDNKDNDSDGLIDYPNDPGCTDLNDNDEFNIIPVIAQCNDGIDNDGDSLKDYPRDPGCVNFSDNDETDQIIIAKMQCNDGIDNDADGLIDYPLDLGCTDPNDNDEIDPIEDFCTLNPRDPSCNTDFCKSHPDDESCKPPVDNFCTKYPTDPNCLPPKTYCENHPELCYPPIRDTELKIITNKVITSLKAVSNTAVGDLVKVVGVTAAGIGAAASIFVANPFSFYDIFLSISRLWSLLLIFFGLKRKSKPWGTVYDSVTKQPIDPAYVVLMDMTGNEVATSITDIEGRYGFSVPVGRYTIMANKTNYEFPSKKLAGKVEDELYNDLYFGGVIEVTEEGGIIAKNIPLDQLNFDWNEYAKNEQHRLRMYDRKDLIIARISRIAFIVGFIITVISFFSLPTIFNTVVLGVYVLTGLAKIFGWRVKPRGSVLDNITEMPLPFSVVRVSSPATNREVLHRVTDNRGKYYILLPNGEYKVSVDRKNPDQTYTPHPIPEDVEVKKGYLKKNFKI